MTSNTVPAYINHAIHSATLNLARAWRPWISLMIADQAVTCSPIKFMLALVMWETPDVDMCPTDDKILADAAAFSKCATCDDPERTC
jgi:hypothetical protein